MAEEDLERYFLDDYTAEDFRITSCSGLPWVRDRVPSPGGRRHHHVRGLLPAISLEKRAIRSAHVGERVLRLLVPAKKPVVEFHVNQQREIPPCPVIAAKTAINGVHSQQHISFTSNQSLTFF